MASAPATPVPTDAPSIVIVMGVSGSGKSTIGSLLAQELGFDFQDGDQFHPAANVEKMHARIPLTDADRRPWLAAIADFIDRTRQAHGHAVVACSALKRRYRQILIGDRSDVRLIYLKGDATLIVGRLTGRHGHFMPPELLNSQFEALEEPGTEENPVTVSIAEPPAAIVARIIAAL